VAIFLRTKIKKAVKEYTPNSLAGFSNLNDFK